MRRRNTSRAAAACETHATRRSWSLSLSFIPVARKSLHPDTLHYPPRYPTRAPQLEGWKRRRFWTFRVADAAGGALVRLSTESAPEGESWVAAFAQNGNKVRWCVLFVSFTQRSACRLRLCWGMKQRGIEIARAVQGSTTPLFRTAPYTLSMIPPQLLHSAFLPPTHPSTRATQPTDRLPSAVNSPGPKGATKALVGESLASVAPRAWEPPPPERPVMGSMRPSTAVHRELR